MKNYEVLGIAYEAYTPQLQARLLRDLLAALETCRLQRVTLVVACEDSAIDWLLGILHIRKTSKVRRATGWLVYYTDRKPEIPSDTQNVQYIQIPKLQNTSKMVTTPVPNPSFPKEQGRDATFISLVDRPMPNGYTPTSPSPIAIWFGT